MPEQEPEREPHTITHSDEQPHTAPQSIYSQPPSQPIPHPTPISTALPIPLHPSSTATTATATATSTTRPTPAQLATITASQLQGMRLLYPGLRGVPAAHLREAVYAHRRYLVMQKLRACGDGAGAGAGVGVGAGSWRGGVAMEAMRGMGMGIEEGVARYRAGHPELGWVSDGGVRASMLFDGERAGWLREGWVVEMAGAGAGDGNGNGTGRLGARRGMGRGVMSGEEPTFVPTREEVGEFRAQCEVMVKMGDRHVRSVVSYLRRRRWRRKREMEDGLGIGLGRVGFEGRSEVERLAVPVEVIRQRISELRKIVGMDWGNVLRAQELQRLLEVENARRADTVDRYRGEGGMVDRGVQTTMVSLQTEGLTALPPVEAIEEGEVDDEESDTDGGMGLDEESRYSGETIESEDFQDHHDLFEEFHGRLL